MHAGFLNVGGEKMSKSLGNYITIPQLLEKFDPKVFRFFIAGLHYRSRVDFNEKAMAQAAKGLGKWNSFIQGLLAVSGEGENKQVKEIISSAREGFVAAMDEDFNLPNAWAQLHEFESKTNSLISAGKISKRDAENIIAFLKELNEIFGFFEFGKRDEKLPEELMALIEQRELYRKKKDFAQADKIRKDLAANGIELLDTPCGVKWKKV